MAWLRLQHGDIAEHDLRQLWRAASQIPWWNHFARLAALAVDVGGGLPSIVAMESHKIPLALPPELLAAFHPAADPDEAPPDHGVVVTEPPTASADHHCHATGVLPEAVAWHAVVGGVCPLPDFTNEPDAECVGALVTAALPLRWALAETLLLLGGGLWKEAKWSLHLATYGVDGRPPSNAAAHAAASEFRVRQSAHADTLAVEVGCSARALEWRLMCALARSLREGDVPTALRVAAARYVRARCAFRGAIVPAGGGRGLDHFAGCFARFRRAAQVEDGEAFREPLRGARRALSTWRAGESVRALRSQGVSKVDLRVDVPELLDERPAWAGAASTDGPPLSFRNVAQLHRSDPIGMSQDIAAIEANPPRALYAIDVVGPEMNFEPMCLRGVWDQLTPMRDRGVHLFIHVGEEYPHVLSGLRRIHFCAERIPLRAGDRLGHAVALADSLPQRRLVPAVVRALDLAWVAALLPASSAWARAEFALVSRHFGRSRWSAFDAWEQALLEESAEPVLTERSISALGAEWVVGSADEQAVLLAAQASVAATITTLGLSVEVCPTSNRVIGAHLGLNLPIAHHAGVRYLLGTDEPGFFSTTLARELAELVICAPVTGGTLVANSQAEWP